MVSKEEIDKLATPLLATENFELIEVKLSRYKRNSRIQLFVDSSNGVTIDDCARLTKLIEPAIEESNLFAEDYVIEISSPGLDRPLKTARDFKTRIGEQIKLVFVNHKRSKIKGELIYADDEIVEVKIEEKKEKYKIEEIDFAKIII